MIATALTLTVWGCRGSLPVTGPKTLRYGGETSCYQLGLDDASLVIDCGSGLRGLGERMMTEGAPAALDILLTHPHFDHLIGLGFFAPLISRATGIRLWSARAPEESAAAIGRLYGPPLWPVRIPGDYPLDIRRLGPDGTRIGPFEVQTFALNHPGDASGFLIRAGGRTVCFATDHEHGRAETDAALLDIARGADLLVYDAAYSGEEYAGKQGWGHSNWDEAQRLAEAAGIGTTLIVHHSPGATDDDLDKAARCLDEEAGARMRFARDGMVIEV